MNSVNGYTRMTEYIPQYNLIKMGKFFLVEETGLDVDFVYSTNFETITEAQQFINQLETADREGMKHAIHKT